MARITHSFWPGVIHRVRDTVEVMLPVDYRCNLPGLRVLGNVRVGMCSDDQNARHRLAVVANLVTALGAAGERQHVTLRHLMVSIVHSDGGLSA